MAMEEAKSPASWGRPPLTTRPEGLLSSLGIQSGGRYPQHLAEELLPTYDLGQWYREYNQQFTIATQTPGAGLARGTFSDTGIQVPDGEMWIVNRLNVYITIAFAAAAISEFALVRTNNADATVICLDTATSNHPTSGGSFLFLNAAPVLPIILRPTVKLRVGYIGSSVNQSTSAGYAFTTQVAYNRCLI